MLAISGSEKAGRAQLNDNKRMKAERAEKQRTTAQI